MVKNMCEPGTLRPAHEESCLLRSAFSSHSSVETVIDFIGRWPCIVFPLHTEMDAFEGESVIPVWQEDWRKQACSFCDARVARIIAGTYRGDRMLSASPAHFSSVVGKLD